MPIPSKTDLVAIQADAAQNRTDRYAKLKADAIAKSDATFTIDSVGEMIAQRVRDGYDTCILETVKYHDESHNRHVVPIRAEVVKAIQAEGYRVTQWYSDNVGIMLTEEAYRHNYCR